MCILYSVQFNYSVDIDHDQCYKYTLCFTIIENHLYMYMLWLLNMYVAKQMEPNDVFIYFY